MIRKVGFRDKFPINLLFIRKLALGTGLIEHNTDIDALAFKSHVGNKRNEGTLNKVIIIHEELSANYIDWNKI